MNLVALDAVLNGIKLHYYRSGGQKPPVILLHGITDDGLCWTPVAEILHEQYDLILIDARGHGKSEAPADGYTYETMAHELAQLVGVLQLEKPVLLGHSMGAVTALLTASLFPDLPRAILLEDPPPFWNMVDSTPGNDEARNQFREQIAASQGKTFNQLLDEVRSQRPTWSEAELAPWVNAKLRFNLRATRLYRPTDINPQDFSEHLKHITCPALLISADPQRGAACNPADIQKLQALIPGLRLAHITGAGHNIRREQFNRYIQTVQGALIDLTIP